MKIAELMEKYEEFCPQDVAEEGDPVGLQVGSLDKEVRKVLVTLDIREQTVDEAIDLGVDLILAKHPIIFRPLKNLTDLDGQEKLVLRLAAAGISVYTSHTNIDIVSDGLNDYFCEKLEIKRVESICDDGLGRVGHIKEQSLGEFIEKMKEVFQQEHFRLISYDHSLEQRISRVAILGGSGGKFWPTVVERKADLYITADIYYHTAHDMLSAGLTAIDPGHYMEKLFIPLVADKLRSFNTGVEVIESKSSTNPFFEI